MIKGGYMGKILHVNLTSQKIVEEDLPGEDVLRQYVGCFGLGLKMLYDRLSPGTAPLDPENPLIFMTGPLTGTSVPAANNLTLTTLNADTGYTVGRSHTHGFFGPNLKRAGYDGLIVEGKAENPVYLWIHDGKVEIRDASKIWGKDTHQTEDLVKEEIREPKASVAAIGPSGENLCAGALIENDKNHSLAHSGVGTIMGSKRLKAIATYGTKDVPLADREKFEKIAKTWRSSLPAAGGYESGVVGGMRNAGIPKAEYKGVKALVGLSTKNWRTTQLPGFGDGMSKQKITPRSCFKCPVACAYDVEILSGPHKGYVATLSGGGENMEGAASIVGITDAGTVFYLTDLYDRLGFETSTVGCTLALAIECYEKGLITKKDTDGLELKWGDAELIEKLLRKMAEREGFGNVLAYGPKVAAEIIGGDAPKFAVHIKGSGMNLHDWRAAWAVLLGQILGGGSGWPAPGADCWTSEPDVGYPEKTNPLTPRGKAEEIRKTGMKKFWCGDSVGVCWIVTWGLPNVTNFIADALSALTGWNFTREEGLEVGERILNLERVSNVRYGLTPQDDYDVSARILEPAPDGPAQGKSIQPYLRGMINEYYRLMGWDEKTGKPWRSTLKRLGLEDVTKDIWGV